MNKRLYLIVATVLILNTLFGSAYAANVFDQIPKIDSLDHEQSRAFLRAGSTTLKNRTWTHVPIPVLEMTLNISRIFGALEPGEFITIGEAAPELCIKFNGCLLKSIMLTICFKTNNNHKTPHVSTVLPLIVSTPIDASFAENPFMQQIKVETLAAAISRLMDNR